MLTIRRRNGEAVEHHAARREDVDRDLLDLGHRGEVVEFGGKEAARDPVVAADLIVEFHRHATRFEVGEVAGRSGGCGALSPFGAMVRRRRRGFVNSGAVVNRYFSMPKPRRLVELRRDFVLREITHRPKGVTVSEMVGQLADDLFITERSVWSDYMARAREGRGSSPNERSRPTRRRPH